MATVWALNLSTDSSALILLIHLQPMTDLPMSKATRSDMSLGCLNLANFLPIVGSTLSNI